MSVADPLVANDYFRTVLKAAVDSKTEPDLFARYSLELDEDDRATILRQLEAVSTLWQKNQDHAKYGRLIGTLLQQHAEASGILTDRETREAAREEIHRQAARQTDSAGALDAAIQLLQHNGTSIPLSRRRRLEQIGRRSGLSSDEVAARLDRERFVDDIGATRPRLDDAIFTEVHERLAALRQAQPTIGPTLFSFLDVPFDTPRDRLASAHASASKAYQTRRYGSELTRLLELLTDARRILVDGDPGLYRASVVEHSKRRLAGRVELVSVANGTISEAKRDELVEECRDGYGLDSRRAEAAISELLLELDVTVGGPKAQSHTSDIETTGRVESAEGNTIPVEATRPAKRVEFESSERTAQSKHQVVDIADVGGAADEQKTGALWWLPTLVPYLGAPISWTYVSGKTHDSHHRLMARLSWVLCVVMVLVAATGIQGATVVTFVYVAQVAHVLIVRRKVIRKIRRSESG